MAECPFCQPQIHQQCFATEGSFMAILNFAPILPGHTLIIPAGHTPRLLDLDPDQLPAFFDFARKVTRFLVSEYQADGFDWSIQDGPSAGQSIDHLHLHIIPRKPGDLPRPGDWYKRLEDSKMERPLRPRLEEEELARLATRLEIGFRSFRP